MKEYENMNIFDKASFLQRISEDEDIAAYILIGDHTFNISSISVSNDAGTIEMKILANENVKLIVQDHFIE